MKQPEGLSNAETPSHVLRNCGWASCPVVGAHADEGQSCPVAMVAAALRPAARVPRMSRVHGRGGGVRNGLSEQPVSGFLNPPVPGGI